MKKYIAAMLLSVGVTTASAQRPIMVQEQGYFSVGGKMIQHEGEYDNSKFVGWATQEEQGQSYRADHAFVHFQKKSRLYQTLQIAHIAHDMSGN